MADRGGLENRCAFAGTVGSNPTLSANSEQTCERRIGQLSRGESVSSGDVQRPRPGNPFALVG